MKVQIPKEVNRILELLYLNKFEGYIVGGCVRDSVLGRDPNDWDICTSAKPHEMLNIFTQLKVIPTGLKHGTLTIVIGDKNFEITTYRIEERYIDGRRPEEIRFTKNLKEDLARRDFTINAIAYNNRDGLIDLYKGMSDILNRKIRCIGNPLNRFDEDYLRMLRAIRFAAQLGYEIETKTFEGIKVLSKNITHISKERVREEINKILLSENPSKGFLLLSESGLLKYIIPELQQCVKYRYRNDHHGKDVFNHIMDVLDNTEGNLLLRLGALLHDVGKFQLSSVHKDNIDNLHIKSMDMVEAILKRLKYDNKTIESVKKLVAEHGLNYDNVTARDIKELINRVGIENIDNLFKLQIAHIQGSKLTCNFSNINKAKDLCEKILKEKQPLTVKELDINGHELMKYGVGKGKEIGSILNRLLDIVLDNPSLNRKDLLINEVEKILNQK
ncbi:MAG: HD domain-containing protein [Clostridia bacterium]|nr:HD domain-containing protein [Clostridia bacterium]